MSEKGLLCPVRLSSKVLECWKWGQHNPQAVVTAVLGQSKRWWTLARLFCEGTAVMELLRSTQLPLGHRDTLGGLWASVGTHSTQQSLGVISIEAERSSVKINKI